MNRITVFFFANVREAIGKKSMEIELPNDALVSDLRKLLKREYPQLDDLLDYSMVAVNKEFSDDDRVIPNNAEIAFFPQVSGGSEPPTVVAITKDALDLDGIVAAITSPGSGAVCMFTGIVRAKTTRGIPHETSYLEYEAYEPMATDKLRQIADEIRQRWDTVEGVAIVQRIGRLKPSTPTVVVACAAAHRDTGVFEAARFGIDRLKEIVTVWKKEITPDGEQWVEGHYKPEPGE